MRLSSLLFFSIFFLRVATGTDVSQTWNELRTKREGLKTFHQEFEISRTFKMGDHSQASKSSTIVDSANGRWRERSISGSGARITIFDGKDLFAFEDGGAEYTRAKRSSKEELAQPNPYSFSHLELSKAVEPGRRSCGLSSVEHACIVLDIPVKPYIQNGSSSGMKVMGGSRRVVFDTVTGLLISSETLQNVDNQRGGYQSDVTYVLTRMSYNGPADESLFSAPSSALKEVKELSRWNADKIKKQLGGKEAPDLAMTDIHGKPIKLSDLKGRTVLLDFWATWCGPCRADGPSLDKLYQKYGDKNLAIIGISVDEEKPVVQKFLSDHPHGYPVVLTIENEMPRAYQIGVFPTYVVIDADGRVASAAEGDKGFSELRRLLKKAGLDTD